jgi:hypothetical protein
MNKTTFPPPIFRSRVLAARLLAEMTGLVWMWDEFEKSGRFVLQKDTRTKLS